MSKIYSGYVGFTTPVIKKSSMANPTIEDYLEMIAHLKKSAESYFSSKTQCALGIFRLPTGIIGPHEDIVVTLEVIPESTVVDNTTTILAKYGDLKVVYRKDGTEYLGMYLRIDVLSSGVDEKNIVTKIVDEIKELKEDFFLELIDLLRLNPKQQDVLKQTLFYH